MPFRNESAWLGSLYPPGTPASEFLAGYCAVFNTVEGNTTLYAWPSDDKVQRWASQMPDDFRFCAKFPEKSARPRICPRRWMLRRRSSACCSRLGGG